MRGILPSLERGKCGLEMVYNFLGNDEKTLRNLYLHHCGKEFRHFFSAVHPKKTRDYPPCSIFAKNASVQQKVQVSMYMYSHRKFRSASTSTQSEQF